VPEDMKMQKAERVKEESSLQTREERGDDGPTNCRRKALQGSAEPH